MVFERHAERLRDRVELIAVQLRQQDMCETHGVENGRRIGKPLRTRILADKARVKARIVCDHGGVAAKGEEVGQHLPDGRRGSHHRIVNSGQLLDMIGNRQLRVHKLRKAVHNLSALQFHRADLDDFVFSRRETGGLNVKDHKAVVERPFAGRDDEFLQVIDQIALDAVDDFRIVLPVIGNRVPGLREGLQIAVVRDGDRLHAPALHLLDDILRTAHGVEIAHFRVTVQLHPLLSRVILPLRFLKGFGLLQSAHGAENQLAVPAVNRRRAAEFEKGTDL